MTMTEKQIHADVKGQKLSLDNSLKVDGLFIPSWEIMRKDGSEYYFSEVIDYDRSVIDSKGHEHFWDDEKKLSTLIKSVEDYYYDSEGFVSDFYTTEIFICPICKEELSPHYKYVKIKLEEFYRSFDTSLTISKHLNKEVGEIVEVIFPKTFEYPELNGSWIVMSKTKNFPNDYEDTTYLIKKD